MEPIGMLIAIKVISMVLGIILNLLVIIVRSSKFFRHRKISSYHFIILQVAFADILFALLLTIDVHQHHLNTFRWLHSKVACRIIKPLQTVSSGVPGLLMMLLAFERYQGIINTLTHRLRTRSIALIGLSFWVLSFLLALPSLLSLQIHPNYGACLEIWSTETEQATTLTTFIIYMIIPAFSTTIFHCRIYYFVRKHTKKMSMHCQSAGGITPSTNNNNNNIEKSRHTTDVKYSSTSFNTTLITADSELCDDSTESRQPFETIGEEYVMAYNVGNEDDVFSIPLQRESHVIKYGRKTFRRILYSGSKLRQRLQRRFQTMRSRTQRNRKLKIHILLAITVCFFVCNLPLELWHMAFAFRFTSKNPLLHKISLVLAGLMYMHCFINGIIYSLVDFKFRRDLKLMVKSIVYRKPYYRNEPNRRVSSTQTRTTVISMGGN